MRRLAGQQHWALLMNAPPKRIRGLLTKTVSLLSPPHIQWVSSASWFWEGLLLMMMMMKGEESQTIEEECLIVGWLACSCHAWWSNFVTKDTSHVEPISLIKTTCTVEFENLVLMLFNESCVSGVNWCDVTVCKSALKSLSIWQRTA